MKPSSGFDASKYGATPINGAIEEVRKQLNPSQQEAPHPLDSLIHGGNVMSTAFPATGKEDLAQTSFKAAGNLVPSGVNFVKGLADFFNPVENVKKVYEAGKSFATDPNAGQPNYTPPSVGDVAKSSPTAAGALVPEFFHHLFAGDIEKAKASFANDPVGSVGPLIALAHGAAEKTGTADAFRKSISETLDKSVKPATSAIDAVKGKAASATEAIKSVFEPKTEAKILATPEADVPKLNKVERAHWYENQKQQIAAKHEAVNTQITQDLQAKSAAGVAESEALQKELATTARDKVLDLRPKIIKSMGEQSKTYRSLVDEAMDGNENAPVDKGGLKSFIDSRFADDPARAAAIKEKLGLVEQVDPLSTKGPSVEVKQPTTTLGKIYQQMKDLRKTTSKSATKTFSPDDKLTDDAVHSLLSYMKDNGVDLAEANKFWAEYAPIRDQLVREAKPFLQADTQTKTLASTLTRVAKGMDVNNENFVKATEDLIGEPITKELKATVSKMDANKKAAVADKIEAEIKKADNEMAKDKALAELSTKQFEAERQARIREIVKTTLKLAAGLEVERAIKKYTGIGF